MPFEDKPYPAEGVIVVSSALLPSFTCISLALPEARTGGNRNEKDGASSGLASIRITYISSTSWPGRLSPNHRAHPSGSPSSQLECAEAAAGATTSDPHLPECQHLNLFRAAKTKDCPGIRSEPSSRSRGCKATRKRRANEERARSRGPRTCNEQLPSSRRTASKLQPEREGYR